MSSSVRTVVVTVLALLTVASSAEARPNRRPSTLPLQPISQQVAFMGYLRDGRIATVYTDERVMIAPPSPAPLPRDPRARGAALLHRLNDQRSGRMTKRLLQLPAGRYGP